MMVTRRLIFTLYPFSSLLLCFVQAQHKICTWLRKYASWQCVEPLTQLSQVERKKWNRRNHAVSFHLGEDRVALTKTHGCNLRTLTVLNIRDHFLVHTMRLRWTQNFLYRHSFAKVGWRVWKTSAKSFTPLNKALTAPIVAWSQLINGITWRYSTPIFTQIGQEV
jgi:hypothetical protein